MTTILLHTRRALAADANTSSAKVCAGQPVPEHLRRGSWQGLPTREPRAALMRDMLLDLLNRQRIYINQGANIARATQLCLSPGGAEARVNCAEVRDFFRGDFQSVVRGARLDLALSLDPVVTPVSRYEDLYSPSRLNSALWATQVPREQRFAPLNADEFSAAKRLHDQQLDLVYRGCSAEAADITARTTKNTALAAAGASADRERRLRACTAENLAYLFAIHQASYALTHDRWRMLNYLHSARPSFAEIAAAMAKVEQNASAVLKQIAKHEARLKRGSIDTSIIDELELGPVALEQAVTGNPEFCFARAVAAEQQRRRNLAGGGVVLIAMSATLFVAPPVALAASLAMSAYFIYEGERRLQQEKMRAHATPYGEFAIIPLNDYINTSFDVQKQLLVLPVMLASPQFARPLATAVMRAYSRYLVLFAEAAR